MEQGVVFGRGMMGYDVRDSELHMDNIIKVKLNLIPQTWKYVLESSSISKWTVKIRERTILLHNTVIGAGSVVTKDIPSNVVAVGNPCKVLREISDHDREFYFKDRKIDYNNL